MERPVHSTIMLMSTLLASIAFATSIFPSIFPSSLPIFLPFSYQFSLLVIQIGYIAELFNCGVGKRSNKFTQSTLKQSNSIVYFIAQNVLFYIQPKPLNWIEFR